MSRLQREHEVDPAEPQTAVFGLLVARHTAQPPTPEPQEEQGRVPGRTCQAQTLWVNLGQIQAWNLKPRCFSSR